MTDQYADPNPEIIDATGEPTIDAPEPEPADTAAESAEEETPKSKAAKDAARYRTQLRDTEAQRDALQTQLNAQRQAILDQAAAAAGVTPAMLKAAEVSLDQLIDSDTGLISTQLITETIGTVASQFNLGPRKPKPDPTLGTSRGAPKPDAWAAAFRQ